MKILFCHLLNNYTGSPRVLATELKLLSKDSNYEISLLTSKTDGVLSNIENIKMFDNGYRWTNNKFFLTLLFIIAQVRFFFFVLFHRFDLIYINTVLPFGAALAAKIRHEKIIYHVHEVYVKSNFLKRLYYNVMRKCAYKIICVSQYVKEKIDTCDDRLNVVYNPIEMHEIPFNVEEYLKKKFDSRIIFMPTSLKVYKGIEQFVELAKLNSNFTFKLLCSVPLEEIKSYFSSYSLPQNLILIGKQNVLYEYYCEAAVTINLSLQDKFIETFGLTLAESFDMLTPAIAPSFGGPLEIIENEKNGFLIDPYDLNQVSSVIHRIFIDFGCYKQLAFEAKKSVTKFDTKSFEENIKKIINS